MRVLLRSGTNVSNFSNGSGVLSAQATLPVRDPRQLEFFPRRAKIEFPPLEQTADCRGLVQAEDSGWYYVKPDSNGKPTRANEWICYQLAERVGIAVPSPCVIEMKSGEWVFGSRKVSAVEDDARTVAFLGTTTLSPGIIVSELGKLLSGIYAFDMCLQNHDRHFKNYLSVVDGSHRTLFAFDFGHSIFWDWPWSNFPPQWCNTRRVGGVLRALHGFDLNSANVILERLALVVKSDANTILNSVPPSWLSDDLRDALYMYWLGGGMDNRILSLKGGLADASLL